MTRPVKAIIVTSADIAAEPGQPLDARYWTGRQDGESHAAWARRTELEREVALVRHRLAELQRLHPEAWAIIVRDGKEGHRERG